MSQLILLGLWKEGKKLEMIIFGVMKCGSVNQCVEQSTLRI